MKSIAIERVSAITAPFDAIYAARRSTAARAATDEMLTMIPPPPWSIAGIAS